MAFTPDLSPQVVFQAVVQGSSLVGLTASTRYAIGRSGTLYALGNATSNSVSAADGAVLYSPDVLIDCGPWQPRGVVISANTTQLTATGLTGGLWVAAPLFSNTQINATTPHGIGDFATVAFIASGTGQISYAPASVNTGATSSVPASSFGTSPVPAYQVNRFMALALFATTWPSPGSGSFIVQVLA